MDEYKVDIRFPKHGDDSIVVITGDEDNVLDAKDHLLNLAEEYVSLVIICTCLLIFILNGREERRHSGFFDGKCYLT